ncbi:MAG TPA: glycine zipper domain-containing protein [Candidatus Hydrogenedentes bacterium]|nr:MAG: hypothetical protein BWY07_02334 [Candidatus Hydrogenedentes bacterium ADurb.Bin170]HOD94977.1 glycine zipper domain-containing protein [Candidatus Hydrogenedentota bacterium]HOM48560.1 glycine zipper domain-containing protein [Candidatus Hydrogenedentota bacterium]HOR49720.1 glycine zipper domain-containing protein [Candidatus Hydrogenedentota bacterium]HPK23850.1 glycine zipper domain-containing protein [Candidatus Hydrogenedentota bacterium]
MKKTAIWCLTLLLGAGMLLSLSGCETYGGAAGLGAGVGALAGGVIGHQSGHALEGAAIGAALGAATGLIAHDIKVKKMRSREETAATYNYQPAQGEMLTLERSEILPATVRPGENADASIQYALLGTGGSIQVSEQRSLLQNGALVADVSSHSFTREDGTWVSTQPFRVPSNLRPGTYTIVTTVRTARSAISGQASFTVL